MKDIERFFLAHRATILVSLVSGALGALFISLFITGMSLAFQGKLTSSFLRDEIFGTRNGSEESGSLRSLFQTNFGDGGESRIVAAVQKASPAVVSISISKNVPVRPTSRDRALEEFFQQFFGYSPFENGSSGSGSVRREIGGGSGFIVSPDGYLVTNRHVVDTEGADYTIFTSDGKKYTAKVIALDPHLDIAVLKIAAENLPYLSFANSDALAPGQTAIAIGNALAEFENTVSVGVISGLARSVVAGDLLGNAEQLEGVIQTDAAINPGNSGGPLLNTAGEVIGMNVAIVTGSQNIGFALPGNSVRSVVESIQKHGKIIRPFLGIQYVLVDEDVKESENLSVDYGAYIPKAASGEASSILAGSPAAKAGIKEGDIILSMNGVKITKKAPLSAAVRKYNVGDTVELVVLREKKEMKIKLTFGELPQK